MLVQNMAQYAQSGPRHNSSRLTPGPRIAGQDDLFLNLAHDDGPTRDTVGYSQKAAQNSVRAIPFSSLRFELTRETSEHDVLMLGRFLVRMLLQPNTMPLPTEPHCSIRICKPHWMSRHLRDAGCKQIWIRWPFDPLSAPERYHIAK